MRFFVYSNQVFHSLTLYQWGQVLHQSLMMGFQYYDLHDYLEVNIDNIDKELPHRIVYSLDFSEKEWFEEIEAWKILTKLYN